MRRVFFTIVVILGSACVEPKFTPVALPACDITWQPLVVGKSFQEAFYDPSVSSRQEWRAGGIASDGIYRELVVISNGDIPPGGESQRILDGRLNPGHGVALQVHGVTTEKNASDFDAPATLLHEGGIGHVFYPVSGSLGIKIPASLGRDMEITITNGIFQEVDTQGNPTAHGLRLCLPNLDRMTVKTTKWPCTQKVLLESGWPLRLIDEAYQSAHKATACQYRNSVYRVGECIASGLEVTFCTGVCHPGDNTQSAEGAKPACVATEKTTTSIQGTPLAFYNSNIMNAHYGEVSDATQRIAVINKGGIPANAAINAAFSLSPLGNASPDTCTLCVVGTRTASGVVTTYFARSGSVTLKTTLPTNNSGTFHVLLTNLVLQEVDSQFNLKPGGLAWNVSSATINTAVRTAGWPCDNLSAVEWASGPKNGFITQAGLDPLTARLQLPSTLFGTVCVPLGSPVILGCTSSNLTKTTCADATPTCSPATNRILTAACVAAPQ